MPRRRATRRAPAKKANVPKGDEGSDLTDEEKQQKLQLYLEDFDREVERRSKEIQEKAERICTDIHNMMRLEMMKVPLSIREMNFEEFMGQGEDIQLPIMEATKATLEGVSAEVKAVTTAKKERPNRQQYQQTCETISEEGEEMNEAAPRTQKKTKRTKKEKVVQGGGASVSQSTRSTRRTKVVVGETPANKIRTAAFTDTPLVTPRIDPRLIATPGFSRLPRIKEKTLHCHYQISEETGSPVKDDNFLIVVKNGEVEYLDRETGRANPVPIDTMSTSDRAKFEQLKVFLSSLPAIVGK